MHLTEYNPSLPPPHPQLIHVIHNLLSTRTLHFHHLSIYTSPSPSTATPSFFVFFSSFTSFFSSLPFSSLFSSFSSSFFVSPPPLHATRRWPSPDLPSLPFPRLRSQVSGLRTSTSRPTPASRFIAIRIGPGVPLLLVLAAWSLKHQASIACSRPPSLISQPGSTPDLHFYSSPVGDRYNDLPD